jgi:predicted dehydrogenase
MMHVGVIGYGYWGPNIVRNFYATEGATVKVVADQNEEVLQKVSKIYPDIFLQTDVEQVVTDPDLDIVAIVTPVSTHFELARKALENGKHIFVEKPFTSTVAQARELIELAEKKKLHIMVDHTFLFTGAVRKIKDLLDRKMLGELYYYDSTRVNLGLFQHDVNVVWDLAPHDFSIMAYVINEEPVSVVATGMNHVGEMENVAYVTVYFQSSLIAHFNVNWLSPVKIRQTLIGGEKKMLVWNDVQPDEKIKVYDKGVETTSREGIYKLLVSYRSGDMFAPRVDPQEALKLECAHFVESITNDTPPINDGHQGLAVVKLLEACNTSLRNDGKMVDLGNL